MRARYGIALLSIAVSAAALAPAVGVIRRFLRQN